MTDFTLRPFSAGDGANFKDQMVETISSDWAIIAGDRIVGRLQADEGAAVVAIDTPEGDLAETVASRFLDHHLLDCEQVTIRANGKDRTFTR